MTDWVKIECTNPNCGSEEPLPGCIFCWGGGSIKVTKQAAARNEIKTQEKRKNNSQTSKLWLEFTIDEKYGENAGYTYDEWLEHEIKHLRKLIEKVNDLLPCE